MNQTPAGVARDLGVRWPRVLGLARVALPCAALLFAMGYVAQRWITPKVVVGRAWPSAARLSMDDIDHWQWDSLLSRYVDDSGNVDYAAWKDSAPDREALDAYLNTVSRADPALAATRENQLAFWINAYNALTVRGILREYPTASIQNHAARFVGYNIWRDLLLRVGDQKYSLGRMEHDILRKMHEPRVHFAIVCASRGCPRLLNQAYTAEKLEAQLQANTRQFFANPLKFNYDSEQRELLVSPIVKWYADDFGSDEAEILKTIAPYVPDEAARRAASTGQSRLSYLDYDWSLNDQTDFLLDAPLPPVAE